MLHVFRRHPDAGIRHHIGNLYGLVRFALLFPDIHVHRPARLRILHGVGQDVNEDLVDAQLVRVQVFMLKVADPEVEVDVLFLHHRLGNVHQVLRAFHNGEGHRTQVQFAALHLGDVQDVVDQRQQVVAGQVDLPQAFLHCHLVFRVLPRDRRKPDDRVHGRPDIMGHGGQEVCLGPVRLVRGHSRRLQLAVQVHHAVQVEYEEQQQARHDNPDQRPVAFMLLQFPHRDHRHDDPVVCVVHPRVANQAFLVLGVYHLHTSGVSPDDRPQLVHAGGSKSVIGLVKLIEV